MAQYAEDLETQGEHRDISNREIRGITIRLMWTVVVSISALLLAGTKIYYTFNERMDIYEIQRNNARSARDIQINQLNLRNDRQDTRIDKLETRINMLEMKSSHNQK
jgi:hypothetical protein